MKLTAPIYHLKRKAKALSRERSIPLNAALDHVARGEGCNSWSLLAARHAATSPAKILYEQLTPGDLVLIGARPGLGKTLMALELAVEAMKAGKHSSVFTLEYTEKQVFDRFRTLGTDPTSFGGLLALDCSDAINAAYIAATLKTAASGTLIVVDYLQLLDQRRESPALAEQVSMLKSLARAKGLIFVFVSQISRAYEQRDQSFPALEDVRLPNPLDLALFDRTCFLNDSGARFQANR